MVSGSNNAPERMPRNNNYNEKYTTPHISITRSWYPKPTPPYIQFEEREQESRIRAAYTPDALYEWNIDSLSEYEIYIKCFT